MPRFNAYVAKTVSFEDVLASVRAHAADVKPLERIRVINFEIAEGDIRSISTIDGITGVAPDDGFALSDPPQDD